jgi:argininosuccinate lyase
MMPQKRNPDTVELARAKAARIAGDFAALAAVMGGLPLGYHRDLQEDKEPTFDAADTLELVLPAVVGVIETMRVRPEAMRRAAAAPELFATDLAEALVRSGVPFREAHHRTGELVRRLEEEGRTLADLDAEGWERFGVPDGVGYLDPDRSVRQRGSAGGPSPASVAAQIDAIGSALASRRSTDPQER